MKKLLLGLLLISSVLSFGATQRVSSEKLETNESKDILYLAGTKTPYSGEAEIRYPSGQLLSVATFKNGKINGKAYEYYPSGQLKLEENYRSTTTILDAANELIKNNKSSKDKKLWTQNGKGDLIKVLASDNARDEVSRIIEIIKENHQNGVPYRDMTILYRTNAQSRLFEEGFLRYNIPQDRKSVV